MDSLCFSTVKGVFSFDIMHIKGCRPVEKPHTMVIMRTFA